MTITLGYWMIPFALTVIGIAWALPLREDERDDGGMFGGLASLPAVFRLGATVIVCLVMWLIWAVLR